MGDGRPKGLLLAAAGTAGVVAAPTAWPHFPQNRAPGRSSALQAVQRAGPAGAPQAGQNLAPPRIVAPHDAQTLAGGGGGWGDGIAIEPPQRSQKR